MMLRFNKPYRSTDSEFVSGQKFINDSHVAFKLPSGVMIGPRLMAIDRWLHAFHDDQVLIIIDITLLIRERFTRIFLT